MAQRFDALVRNPSGCFVTLVTSLLMTATIPLAAAHGCGAIEAKDAWIALAPPNIKVHAGYLTLTNTSDSPCTIVGAESPAYSRIEFHSTSVVNGIATMQHLAQLEVGTGKSVTFAPGGLHLMLMQPADGQSEGQHIPISVIFADGSKAEIEAVVAKSKTASAHKLDEDHGTHHQHHTH